MLSSILMRFEGCLVLFILCVVSDHDTYILFLELFYMSPGMHRLNELFRM